MKNILVDMVEKRKMGIHSGIPSFCSANKIVIEAIMEQSKRFDDYVLIEATSNQVNQFGGYMSMTPKDFKDYVYEIAEKISFDKDKIILGGDHLGPQPWQDLDEKEAMENSKKLVRLCVESGYMKIHLDTSMKLGSDPKDEPLDPSVVARRGAILYEECEKAFKELKKKNPNAIHPVFVIGSEVPIPGGSQEEEDSLKVTDPDDFENTLKAYKKEFSKKGLDDAWNYIIAVVVQPGVEFGNADIHQYNRLESKKLCDCLKKYPDIVFEGHSTDYQPPEKLREMVEDGIAIIKVGPALTFSLREALFSLAMMEKELVKKEEWSNFIEVLDEVMLENPKNWKKHYHGSEKQIALARKYSFSDRCRYYLTDPKVVSAMQKLFSNFDEVNIPLHMLHQYMPNQYIKVRDGKLELKARELVKDHIVNLVEDYNYAVKHNYIVSGIFVR
ncbi:MAG: class II D-tagatose-bisphosphate aldolase, non-catalytic subunit [Bacilli bacterium]|nr:class II D-tagatose-bisphosphate aldolase, non-catalytic subunit [bacterium]